MASTFKAITDTMSDLNISLWQIKSRGGSLIGYQLDPKMDIDGSIERMKRLLKEQSGDTLSVFLQPNKSKNGDMTKVIRMEVDLSTVDPQKSVAGIGNFPAPDLSRMEKMISDLTERNNALSSQLIESKYENKIKELEAKISGVNADDPIGKVLELIAPVIAAYVPKLLNPNQPDINGTPEQDLLIQRFIAVDPDAIQVINAIVYLAENNPTLYSTYKPMLINISNGE